MFPMITGIEELRDALAVCAEARDELRARASTVVPDMPVGMMIETPSAAVLPSELARECDFLSIGSNDLIQYTLAMDRGNRRVSYLYRPLHPAILRLVHGVVEAGHAQGVWVGLCGEMGSETRLAEVLLGLGLDEISMHSAALPKIKQVIRWTELAEARRVVEHLPDASDLREADSGWPTTWRLASGRARNPRPEENRHEHPTRGGQERMFRWIDGLPDQLRRSGELARTRGVAPLPDPPAQIWCCGHGGLGHGGHLLADGWPRWRFRSWCIAGPACRAGPARTPW